MDENHKNSEEERLREFNAGYARDIAFGMSWYRSLNIKAKTMFSKRILELIAANTPDGWDPSDGPGLDEVEEHEHQVKVYMIYKLASVGLMTLVWMCNNNITISEVPHGNGPSPK